ncbi:hypothetical protein PRIC2_014644 [Phytophthora ramorum]
MRELGKDPLTWSFVKLLGFQLSRELREFEGLPLSHAWRWKSAGLWRARLLTKAQCSGVIVSVVERADRVELLVDDGSALVKAVVWGQDIHAPVVLGDLVHVEGKLNVDRNWDLQETTRELRVLRVSKVQDPNEELLHWTQVMELSDQYYSAAAGELYSTQTASSGTVDTGAQWEDIAAEAFFSLGHTALMRQLASLSAIMSLQSSVAQMRPGDDEVTSKNQRIHALQYVFRTLRRAGLLFLEDDVADRHVLLSFEAALKPALLQLLEGRLQSRSIAELADAVLAQERFKCIPLQWIETGLEKLLMTHLVAQREETQLFCINDE